MDKPFSAYRGDEPFVFVCYAHSDSEEVYSDLSELHHRGIHLWYDEGIPAGTSWRAEIATAIEHASKFLFFISDSSLQSKNCLREVDFALNHDIEIVPVYLEPIKLPGELALVLNRVHALFRSTDSKYMEHLAGALQGNSGLLRVPFRNRKSRFNPWLPAIGLGAMALAAIGMSQWNGNGGGSTPAPGNAAAPNAFNLYLEALPLVERWDLGNNLEDAIDLFSEATELDPGFALGFARLADALRIRAAITGEETWLDQATAHAATAMSLNPDLAPVQVAMGRIQAAQGNYDLATAALERALAIDPNDATANQAIARLYENLGRLDDADEFFRHSVNLEPDNAQILDAYANFLDRQGRMQEAIEVWRRLIGIAPDHYAGLVNLGGAFASINRIPEAITIYEQANSIRPSYMGYSNLGTMYGITERYQEAEQAYRQALELDDSDYLAWGNLGYIYSWMGAAEQQSDESFARAIELAESARQSNLRNPTLHKDLAFYYAKTEQEELALQRLQAAQSLSGESGEINAIAAEVYEVLGQRGTALQYLQTALGLGYSRAALQRNPDLVSLLADPALL